LETQKETTKNIELEHQIELLKKDLEHIKLLLLETDKKKNRGF
jgi:hypothetical protein